ncbi:MAG: nuclear transport factor 2 family protein [Rhodobacteraceae bacterium]|jgi:ketosteroid isomerase-like protein|nr:nuclear transport factor 2 family protein [Paracoccaceae bacterium]
MQPHAVQLPDIAAITALRVAFGHAVDTRDWPALDRIFAPEVDVDLSSFGVPAARMARAEVAAIFRHAFRHDHVRTFQAYSNFQVEVEGDRATMISLLHGHHAGEGFDGGRTFDLRGRYTNGLMRTGEGWRILSTTLEVIAMDGNVALVA